MWVATNRQRPPEDNPFARRARRRQEAGRPVREPVEVSEDMPDLQALREAQEKAADELTRLGQELQPETPQGPETTPVAVPTEDEAVKRGRPATSAVAKRTARVLEIVTEAEQVGISKPDIASIMKEKETQVYTSLRQLQQEGKVETRQVPDTRTYRWYRV